MIGASVGVPMTHHCLLLPLNAHPAPETPWWAIVWPSPNLRTHLEYREHLQPRVNIVAASELADDEPPIPRTVPVAEAQELAKDCLPLSHAEFALDRGTHQVTITVKGTDGVHRSDPFPVELLDAVSPPHDVELDALCDGDDLSTSG